MSEIRYLEIIEVLDDSYALPETIRLRVSDRADAIEKSKEYKTSFLGKANVKVMYHKHTHGPNEGDTHTCITEDIKKEAEKAVDEVAK